LLRSLQVRNLAVLAGGDVALSPGLNVLTGETGAGKSLVVDSLALLAGARAASDAIREGADGLSVAGVFDRDSEVDARLAEAGLESGGDELVVRREIGREGRNRIFVDDQPVTLRLLQEVAPRLLRIHGQRDEQALVEPGLQRRWLDRSGGAAGEALAARVAAAFAAYRELAERLERVRGDDGQRAQRIDFLRFQLDEIAAARVAAGEEETLRTSRDQLRHREAIARALGAAFAALHEDEGAVSDRLGEARRELGAIAAWEPAAAAALPELDELLSRAEELARELGHRLDAAGDADPGRLDEVEERLALLERLLRKHGGSTAELLARRDRMAAELRELDASEEDRSTLENAVEKALRDYAAAAGELAEARGRWAKELGKRLSAELADLALGRAKFEVALERAPRAGSPLVVEGQPVDFGAHGYDQVTFRFAPNPGEPMQPLSRIASGGELSRVSLALQLAARGDEVAGGPALVFDEVDAGIGGAEGAAIGRKLRRLARHGQILAVTHLPQVASFGHAHHRVSKRVRGGRTYAEVEALDPAGRTAEVARMLSGEKVTAASLSHAAEMLQQAAGAAGSVGPGGGRR
jgi:DNA repair protein RecN (Recombination protein N)